MSTKDALRCRKRAIARETCCLLVHPAPVPRTDDLRPMHHARGLTLTQAAHHLGTVTHASANSNAAHVPTPRWPSPTDNGY
jgi:hypothetical protein